MGQRALSLKAPYGAAFMMQLDGSVWLVYDNDAKGTSDVDILNWLRNTAISHSEQVERNLVAENRREVAERPIQLEPSAQPGIAEKVLSTLTQPIKVETPVARQHDYGGPYRIGAACKVCGTKATGLEVQACPGVMISPVPSPKGPTVNEILSPKPNKPSIVPVTPPAVAQPPASGTTIPEVPLHTAAPLPNAPFPPPKGQPLASPMNLKAPVPRIETNPNAPVPPPIPPLEKAAPPLGAPFPPPNSPAEGTRQTAPVNPPNGSSRTEQG